MVFIDVDGIAGCQDTTHQDAIFNAGEAALVQLLVRGLRTAGLKPEHVGVVSTYRAQVSLVQRLIQQDQQQYFQPPAGSSSSGGGEDDTKTRGAGNLQSAHHSGDSSEGVEVLTIDKYQGRDKQCIIVSFVRSNTQGITGRLLTDWQRINVALTRAKHKMILLGSCATLKSVPILDAMISLLRSQGQIMKLPTDAAAVGNPP